MNLPRARLDRSFQMDRHRKQSHWSGRPTAGLCTEDVRRDARRTVGLRVGRRPRARAQLPRPATGSARERGAGAKEKKTVRSRSSGHAPVMSTSARSCQPRAGRRCGRSGRAAGDTRRSRASRRFEYSRGRPWARASARQLRMPRRTWVGMPHTSGAGAGALPLVDRRLDVQRQGRGGERRRRSVVGVAAQKHRARGGGVTATGIEKLPAPSGISIWLSTTIEPVLVGELRSLPAIRRTRRRDGGRDRVEAEPVREREVPRRDRARRLAGSSACPRPAPTTLLGSA